MRFVVRYRVVVCLLAFAVCTVFVQSAAYSQQLSSKITSTVAKDKPVYHSLPPAVFATPSSAPIMSHNNTIQEVLDDYNSGNPTAEEQYLLELINLARSNPDSEGIRLFNTTDADVNSGWDYWIGKGQSETRAQVKADFATYPAVPPLAFNPYLIAAARGHSTDMLVHDFQGHPSSDGTDPFVRIADSGYTGTTMGENVDAYGTEALDIHESFEIDWGQPTAGFYGHRQNIINYAGAVYTEIGLGMIHGTNNDVGPILTTEDFGDKGDIFILGVVYDDQDHNLFYSMGEGLAGVKITVTGAQYSATTSTSGGYAIPVTGQSGVVTVTATGGGLTAPVTRQVDIDGKNIKVDFIKDYTGFPYQPALIAPIADTVISSDTGYFSWVALSGVTKYHIQVATDSAMKNLVLDDMTLTTSTRKFTGLHDSTTYYWRVSGMNDKGWGQYSLDQSFSVLIPVIVIQPGAPAAPTLVSPADRATVPDSDLTIIWHKIPAATKYVYAVATDAAFSNLVANDIVNGVNDTSVTLVAKDDFYALTKYYWRINSENENGTSPASEVWSFTTGDSVNSSVVMPNSIGSSVSVTPNPTTGVTRIHFTTATGGMVSLKVYDLLGVEQGNAISKSVGSGASDLNWDFTGKPAGVYYYELSIGSETRTGQIVVVK